MLAIFLGCFLISASSSWGRESLRPFWGEMAWHQAAGGVFLEDDSEGIFLVNPALLGRRNNWHWRLVDAGLGLSALSAYQSFYGRQWGSQPSDYQDLLGRSFWANAQGMVLLNFWQWGLFWHRGVDWWFWVTEPMNPTLSGYLMDQISYGIARGWHFEPGLRLGLSLRRIDFRGGPVNLLVGQILSSQPQQLLQQVQGLFAWGTGYGVDLGWAWDLIPDRPNGMVLSGAWHRVGFVGLGYPNHFQAPMIVIPDQAYLQFHAVVPFVKLGWLRWGVQWRDPHKPGSLGTKWHTGFDWQLGLFNIQAGFYQGYSSVGMGIDLYLLRLNVAFFRVEQGYYAGQWPQDRFTVNLDLQWFRDNQWDNRDSWGNRRPLWIRR